jgi:CheY-like chemotaxis protein
LRHWCLEKFGLTLEVEAPEDIDPGLDDSVTLFLCVRELLFNIVKHAGVKTAELRMWRSGSGGDLTIEVKDEGVGFDPALVRAHEGLTGGFGLFNVRERLEMLGGGMEALSLPGCGSRFTLWLPARAAAPVPGAGIAGEAAWTEAMDQGLAAAAAAAAAAAGEAQAGPIRLVVADDNSGVRASLVRRFQAETDFEVVGQAANGLEAVALARQLRPQIVLMDVNMPRMNGLEATALIRRELPAVQVLGISTHVEVEIRVAMIRAGALDLLPKEQSDAFLAAILRRHAGAGGKRQPHHPDAD